MWHTIVLKEVKPFLLKAHESLLEATDLVKVLRNLRNNGYAVGGCKELSQESELSFLGLGDVWQAPLFEIILNYQQDDKTLQNEGLVNLLETFTVHFSKKSLSVQLLSEMVSDHCGDSESGSILYAVFTLRFCKRGCCRTLSLTCWSSKEQFTAVPRLTLYPFQYNFSKLLAYFLWSWHGYVF